jgi:phosphoglycerate dehydrogenase-like enzyme
MLERGLIVTNWGPAAAPAVAEAALLLVLACLRRLNAWSFVMHGERGWVGKPMNDSGVGLYGRRVAVHGFGNIARQFLRLIAPFGCDVTVYSEGVPSEVFVEHGVREAPSLAALFAGAEVVVDVEALNERTRGSVTEPLLRSIADGGVFVNVGRGAVVDERALERGAAEGRLQIGLDVYEKEPLPATSPLRGLANVTLTPHVAGPTRDQRRACGARAVEALCRFAAGEPVDRPVGLDEFDRST